MMFEHLDDPEGFVPVPRLRVEVAADVRRRRRRRRFAGAGVGLALAVGGAVAGTAAVVQEDLDRIEHVDVAGLTVDPAAGEPFVVVLVGVDAVSGSGASSAAPPASGVRSDAVVVALVEPSARRVSAVPLPRDLWVDIPGHGPGRLNQAVALGGRSLLVETLREGFGIEAAHYVEVDLEGARRIGDEVGGVRLAFDTAVRDRATGLAVPAGCQVLDGTGLLALARSRGLERETPSGWRIDPSGDLGRIERQQAIGVALLGALAGVDRSDPRALAGLLDAAAPHLTLDGGTSDGDLLGLVRGIVGSDVRPLRLPVQVADVGGAVVLLPGPGAGEVLGPLQAAQGGGSVPVRPAAGATPLEEDARPVEPVVPGPC